MYELPEQLEAWSIRLGRCDIAPDHLTAASAHRIMQTHAHWMGSPCAQRRAALNYLVRTGRYVLDSRRRHLQVSFQHLEAPLDFQCDCAAAEEFATILDRTRTDLEVVIDRNVHPDMPPLPCATLWSA
ncbi:hypothetical protein [Nocardia sp. NBC_00403]|uniref:hypothetical protein n=1 Tax=Nocardia sp. NBC_00403 TaxID=2975990 RepID=UPI002E20F332